MKKMFILISLIIIFCFTETNALEKLTQEQIEKRKNLIENKVEQSLIEKKQETINKLKNELKETNSGSQEKKGFFQELLTTLFGEKYKNEGIIGSLVLLLGLIGGFTAIFVNKKN